ncbi:MAG: cytochrome P460 family protein [Terracidiphilus sp.]
MKKFSANPKNSWSIAITALFAFALVAGAALADQDRYTLTAPNGIAISEFRGYDEWQDVAVSATDTGIKAILGNSAMIQAYRDGIPGNGKPFPDGAAIVKIEWMKAPNPVSPYSVEVPATLRSVSFIEKDSKRFPDTSGWGYAQFLYAPATRTFKPYGADSSFGKKVCYQCHIKVAARDYIFTGYPDR